jgi:hypothetical protein
MDGGKAHFRCLYRRPGSDLARGIYCSVTAVLAICGAATEAISAALECARAGDAAGLPLHLGLHAGDVIRERGDVYGEAVNVAARISGAAAPGEVLVSDVVRVLARTSAGVRFVDRGGHELRGGHRGAPALPARSHVVRCFRKGQRAGRRAGQSAGRGAGQFALSNPLSAYLMLTFSV